MGQNDYMGQNGCTDVATIKDAQRDLGCALGSLADSRSAITGVKTTLAPYRNLVPQLFLDVEQALQSLQIAEEDMVRASQEITTQLL